MVNGFWLLALWHMKVTAKKLRDQQKYCAKRQKVKSNLLKVFSLFQYSVSVGFVFLMPPASGAKETTTVQVGN